MSRFQTKPVGASGEALLFYFCPNMMCSSPQKKAKGEELFDQIMYHLDIIEKDYFGLRFMDSAQVPVRLQLPSS